MVVVKNYLTLNINTYLYSSAFQFNLYQLINSNGYWQYATCANYINKLQI